MAGLEAIWKCARDDLIIGRGQSDVFLWEHSARVARSAAMIADLPEAASRRVDLPALVSAALYVDAGWACQYQEGLIERCEILSRPTNDLQRELGAGLMEERLADLLSRQSLNTAAASIRQLTARDNPRPEAQVLAEADNLNAIGALSFWLTVRRHSNEGKGIQAAIDTWQRRKEYSFWEARISESFRFASVRELAQQRLRQFGEFMDVLARQHRGDDVAGLAGLDPSTIEATLPSFT